MAKQKTLVLIKPDVIQRGLAGQLIARLEAKGLQLLGARLLRMQPEQAGRLYEPHFGKPFYEPLVKYMTSGPILALCVSGHGAIDQVRTLMGATDPANAAPGTIRGDWGQRLDYNCVHGSDSPESAAREIPIFFAEGDLAHYDREDASFTTWV